MQYVWMVIVGFVVGLLARALLPGDQKLGIIMTAVLGIVGSFVPVSSVRPSAGTKLGRVRASSARWSARSSSCSSTSS